MINAFEADKQYRLAAIGDAFPENARAAAEALKGRYPDRVDLTEEKVFGGPDCYKKVIPNCDVVFLCETPYFRQFSLRAAVEAGKHVFCEKPVATDAAGVRSVLDSVEIARKKGLNLAVGLDNRYDFCFNEMLKRVQDGAIGEICSAELHNIVGKLWTRPKLEKDTELMYQVRNWYNFTWLSGDFIVEQAIHRIDKGFRIFGEMEPESAFGIGARMARTEQPAYGDIYDAMSVVYEYPFGKRVYSYYRQQNNTMFSSLDSCMGSKGYAILSGKGAGLYDHSGHQLYERKKRKETITKVQEHIELSNAIRSGGSIYMNNGKQGAIATLIAILGREACYSGNRIRWSDVWKTPCWPEGIHGWDATPPAVPDKEGRYLVNVPGLGKVYHQVVR
ncbi:MAG: Gfo/Idh/MocA family oxidoreductase [Planctomycetia bacterium]|nr:Gfo/Idh/MocA family oxidoreductase [Planctomycetia bacterium]